VASAQEAPLHRGQGRVLVMDDEEAVCGSARRMLDSLGYEVELAADGSAALEMYRKARDAGRPFDLLIMDLTIPGGLGGKETIRRLLELDPLAKAVVSSGYSNDPVMADHRTYGFVGVLAKPYQIAELSEVLHRTLDGVGSRVGAEP